MTTQLEAASLVAMIGWLALAILGYSSYRLNWKKSVTMALIWAAIFIGVFGLVVVIQGEAIGLSL